MASVLALSRSEFEQAKTIFRWRYVAHIVTAILYAISLFIESDVSNALALAAILSELAAFALRLVARKAQSRAARGLRYAMLEDSFGALPRWYPLVELEMRFSRRATKEADQWEDPVYFSSKAPPGLRRYAENLRESATYSKILATSAGNRIAIPLLLFTLFAACVTVLVILFSSREIAIAETGVLTVIFSVLIASDLISTMIEYGNAGDTATLVAERIFNPSSISLISVIALSNDYVEAIANCPPIPTSAYLREKDRIEEALSKFP